MSTDFLALHLFCFNIRQHGHQMLYFKLHVDGRKFHYRRPQVVHRRIRVTLQVVGISAKTYKPQSLRWFPDLSPVSGSSFKQAFQALYRLKCAFLGFANLFDVSSGHQRCFWSTALQDCFLRASRKVSDSLISTHLTWIPCGDWIDRRRHSKTLSFCCQSALFFCYLKLKSRCSKTTSVFLTHNL